MTTEEKDKLVEEGLKMVEKEILSHFQYLVTDAYFNAEEAIRSLEPNYDLLTSEGEGDWEKFKEQTAEYDPLEAEMKTRVDQALINIFGERIRPYLKEGNQL